MEWNYPVIYEAIAKELPDLPCQVQGDREISWSEFDRNTDSLAGWLLERGLPLQAKVGIYLRNCPEFLETYVACLKARLVPVNVNFRYGHDELLHVFRNADVEAVVFHGRYAATLARVQPQLPSLRHFLCVEDGSRTPEWAATYGEVVAAGAGPVEPARSGDDALLLYTGGTTGMPKGVVWRQDEVIRALGTAANFYMGEPPARDLDDLVEKVDRSGKRLYVACPLMHATGLFTSLSLMNEGWAVETSATEHFDPAALLQLLSQHRVNALVIVGDAFARPLLAELEADPDAYDLSHLELIISAGSVWSQKVRAATVERLPWVALCDNYGSSEALRGVQTYSRPGEVPASGVIAQSELLGMVDDDGRLLDISVPGNRGALVIKGHLADGYYKDQHKSGDTWVVIEGERRCVTGDYGVVEQDGAVRLLGRGNAVVNTGGEKVFPQEVEEVVRAHRSVTDAAVIGLPNERFGQVVTAVVQLRDDAELELSTLAAHVKRHLAAYKAPRELVPVPAIPRTANGKIDYNACHAIARATLNVPAAS